MDREQQHGNDEDLGWTGQTGSVDDEYLEKFLDGLRETCSRFDWRLLPDFGKDSDPRTTPRYRLRAVALDGPAAGTTFEPLGALCYTRTGQIHSEDAWSEAARALGLPSLCVADIIAAANDHTWSGPGGQREPVAHLQALRSRLIRSVGLRVRPGTFARVVGALIAGGRAGQKVRR